MNKSQLVDALADRLGDRKTAATAVDALLQIVVDTVRSGDSVSLAGFGVFESRARAARTGRNPRTGRPSRCRRQRCPPSARGPASAAQWPATWPTPPRPPRPPRLHAPGPTRESPVVTGNGDERFGRQCGTQRRSRPHVGAHHDTVRHPPATPVDDKPAPAKKAAAKKGTAKKTDAKAAKSTPKADGKKGKKSKKGK